MGTVGLEPTRLAAHDPKSCSSANFDTSPETRLKDYTMRLMQSHRRIWLERFGVALITVIALGAPLLMGLVTYLAFTDNGISLSAGDPFNEKRVWMVKEPRNWGIAYTYHDVANAQTSASASCARLQFVFLKFSGGVKLERSAGECQCYERGAAGWTRSPAVCRAS